MAINTTKNHNYPLLKRLAIKLINNEISTIEAIKSFLNENINSESDNYRKVRISNLIIYLKMMGYIKEEIILNINKQKEYTKIKKARNDDLFNFKIILNYISNNENISVEELKEYIFDSWIKHNKIKINSIEEKKKYRLEARFIIYYYYNKLKKYTFPKLYVNISKLTDDFISY